MEGWGGHEGVEEGRGPQPRALLPTCARGRLSAGVKEKQTSGPRASQWKMNG